MKYQLTSAQGPEECEIAVVKFLQLLKKEFPNLRVIKKEPEDSDRACRSALIEYNGPNEMPQGTIQWICQSPCRPKHKRKNWFIGIFALQEISEIVPDMQEIRFETFRSMGKGGQNVNKTETGVRAVYQPTGQSAVSMQERSQYANKRIALERLLEKIREENNAQQMHDREHQRNKRLTLERGNPVRVYQGMRFQRIL